MNINWEIINNETTEQNIHQAYCAERDEASIKNAIDTSIEKAVNFLPNNVQDDSLYFLVEWLEDTNTLNIIVTDDSKHKESPEVTRCIFSHIDKPLIDPEKIQYWTRDFLTTSGGFIRFSLVAIFCCGDRNKTVLL